MLLGYKFILSFIFAACLSQPCFAIKISGIIRTNEGLPVANVSIFVGKSNEETKSNADGAFNFETRIRQPVIFIAHPGYRPIAKIIQLPTERVDLTLEPESLSTWWLATCPSKRFSKKVIEDHPKIPLPKGVRYIIGQTDIDYRVDLIETGHWWNPQRIEYWIGPSAGGPIPPDYLLENAKEFSLRFWRSKDRSTEGIDARGIDSKGRHWRHVNIGSHVLMYRNASDELAKDFDRIIEGMCMP